MAREVNFTKDDDIFAGEDKFLKFQLWDDTDPDNPIPLDGSGFEFAWVLRVKDNSSTALLEKLTGGFGITLEGTFNVDPELNTQFVVVRLFDTDTAGNDGVLVIRPGTYRHSLKRTDEDNETIFAFGKFVLREATIKA